MSLAPFTTILVDKAANVRLNGAEKVSVSLRNRLEKMSFSLHNALEKV